MAGEPWTDAQNTIVEAGGFLRVVPLTTSEDNEKEISALGTKADFLKTCEEIDIYSNTIEEKQEYKYRKLANGTILRVEKLSPMIDAASGLKVSKDSESADQFVITVLTGKSDKDLIVSWIREGTPLIASVSLGINALRENTGFAHLLGKISGDIKEIRQDELSELSFVIKGGSAYTVKETISGTPDILYSDYNSLACGSGNTIEPVGKSAFTIKALTESDWGLLLSGKTVRTDND